jgi:hypothetical protein
MSRVGQSPIYFPTPDRTYDMPSGRSTALVVTVGYFFRASRDALGHASVSLRQAQPHNRYATHTPE